MTAEKWETDIERKDIKVVLREDSHSPLLSLPLEQIHLQKPLKFDIFQANARCLLQISFQVVKQQFGKSRVSKRRLKNIKQIFVLDVFHKYIKLIL